MTNIDVYRDKLDFEYDSGTDIGYSNVYELSWTQYTQNCKLSIIDSTPSTILSKYVNLSASTYGIHVGSNVETYMIDNTTNNKLISSTGDDYKLQIEYPKFSEVPYTTAKTISPYLSSGFAGGTAINKLYHPSVSPVNGSDITCTD